MRVASYHSTFCARSLRRHTIFPSGSVQSAFAPVAKSARILGADEGPQVEREIARRIRHLGNQRRLGEHDIRPTAVGIVEQQHFGRERGAIHDLDLDQGGRIGVGGNELIDGGGLPSRVSIQTVIGLPAA